MRFKLTLSLRKTDNNTLPLNYQYELSSWIYKVLNNGSPEFSRWLHEKGYADDHKSFKLFTFSNLDVPARNVNGDRMEIRCREISLVVSIFTEEMIGHFITGLFQDQEFRLGDRISQVALRVTIIERLTDPVFTDQMRFRPKSPILISFLYPGERYARYLRPDHPDYQKLIFRNLKEKYRTINGREHSFKETDGVFNLLSVPKMKGIVIKAGTSHESKIIGYLFDFRIHAPAELIRFGYYTGFGEKNSLGFGCAEVRD